MTPAIKNSESPMDALLEVFGKNMDDVANASNISFEKLNSEQMKNSDSISGETIKAIALAINRSPGYVLDELIKFEDIFHVC